MYAYSHIRSNDGKTRQYACRFWHAKARHATPSLLCSTKRSPMSSETENDVDSRPTGLFGTIGKYVILAVSAFPLSILSVVAAGIFTVVFFAAAGGVFATYTGLAVFGFALVISHFHAMETDETEPPERSSLVETIDTILIIAYFNSAIFVAVTLAYTMSMAGYPALAILVAIWYPGYELLTARRGIPLNLLSVYAVLIWSVETAAVRTSEFSTDDWKDRYADAAATISHTMLRFSPPRRSSLG